LLSSKSSLYSNVPVSMYSKISPLYA
jgi:hypothetical protein